MSVGTTALDATARAKKTRQTRRRKHFMAAKIKYIFVNNEEMFKEKLLENPMVGIDSLKPRQI